ncbi:MAG: radical SAM protein [Elusimicrobia bacterium]|nr:radical SAM protein [Elusimicrobiota bacterium]
MFDVKQFSSDKILSHIGRISEWLETGSSRPITYELDMTNICNNDCPFCFGFHKRKDIPAALDPELAVGIVDQIKEFGGKGLTFTGGGEPTCNRHTMEVVEYSKKKGLDVGFISNGLLLDESRAERLVKNCMWIRISLDAGTQEVYEKTHGLDGDAFEKVLKNVEMLVSMKKNMGKDVTIGLGYLTPPLSREDMRDFVLLGKKLGVDYSQFRPILRRFGEKRINFDTKETIDYIRELLVEYSDDNTRILYSHHKYEALSNGHIVRPYDKCYGHHFATVIAADAKMYLCCHTRGIEKYCIGDLKKNSLKDIWGSALRKKVYDNIDFKDCPYLCRCDSFNTILWHVKRDKVHKNFL